MRSEMNENGRHTILPDGRLCLQQGGKTDVIFGHDTIDHVMWASRGLYR